MSGQLHSPAALPPGKDPLILIGQEADRAQEPVCKLWTREKSLPCQESNPDSLVSKLQPIRYTDSYSGYPDYIL
jgi:hypothetical protein